MANPIIKKGDPFGVQKLPAAVRGLVELFAPQDDPFGGIGPTPLISIYKTAKGIPSKALRQKGTKDFLKSAANVGKNFSDAANWFADKYPRVAAHMRISPKLLDSKQGSGAAINAPSWIVNEPIKMQVSKLGRLLADENPANARDYIAHEGTHVAQALGNRHTDFLYRSASELGSYLTNPFEIAARERGQAARLGKYKVEAPVKALQLLKHQVSMEDPKKPLVRKVSNVLKSRE